jgi:phage tail sheath protein FI
VLDDIDDIDLVCVPDLMIAEIRRSEDIVFELQREVLEYCHDMGERFAILDGLPLGGVTGSVEVAIRQRSALAQAGEASAEGALYVPWVRVRSLDGSGEECVPASGHIAGIYARSDRRFGFHKAPANEIVEGVVDLERHMSHAEHGSLNESSVNCLQSFPRRGIRVWGARTLSGHRQWRYVNVRRVILTIVRWIKLRMNDLVFEGNDATLWDRVRDHMSGQCYQLFEQGALKGRTAEEAFFIKCDAELNSAEEREAGRVVCDIGLAPLSPAEFIVMRVTQDRARGTATVVPIRA